MYLIFFQNIVLLFAEGCEGVNHCLQHLEKNTVRLDGHNDIMKFSQNENETNPSGTCQRKM